MNKYKIEITPIVGERTGGRDEAPYTIEIETDNLNWSMEQYQRNRQPLNWKVV